MFLGNYIVVSEEPALIGFISPQSDHPIQCLVVMCRLQREAAARRPNSSQCQASGKGPGACALHTLCNIAFVVRSAAVLNIVMSSP